MGDAEGPVSKEQYDRNTLFRDRTVLVTDQDRAGLDLFTTGQAAFYNTGPNLIREVRAMRRLMLRHPPANNQRSAALFLAMGYHEALLRRLRQATAERENGADGDLDRLQLTTKYSF